MHTAAGAARAHHVDRLLVRVAFAALGHGAEDACLVFARRAERPLAAVDLDGAVEDAAEAEEVRHGRIELLDDLAAVARAEVQAAAAVKRTTAAAAAVKTAAAAAFKAAVKAAVKTAAAAAAAAVVVVARVAPEAVRGPIERRDRMSRPATHTKKRAAIPWHARPSPTEPNRRVRRHQTDDAGAGGFGSRETRARRPRVATERTLAWPTS